MELEFQLVHSEQQILLISQLAARIWTGHFIPIIGALQVEYMLERYQSVLAISAQVKSGVRYELVYSDGLPVGYFAIQLNSLSQTLFLSKLYLDAVTRKRGYGARMISHIEQYCIQHSAHQIWLTVNRNNATSIAFYERMGFSIVAEVIQDIGNGFVMDDYRMEKSLL